MPNRLQYETSPYLLQHAQNPVDWYPWSEEAFCKAREEDKPVFLSIGYSTCHWCHVMARESFEDAQIAKLLNQYFVSIKVDREERPDVDSIYMAVCQAFTGSGGWPTSIFMTPDQKPFFAGTYFPRHSRGQMIGFEALLQVIHDMWESDRAALIQRAEAIVRHLRQSEAASNEPSENLIESAIALYSRAYDPVYGGFGLAPKFPTPHNILFLLACYERRGDEACLKMARHTLEQMYRGGLFDHIGFGFCRYSTDGKFLVPHFEKMLYDNALMILAYVKAFSVTREPLYLEIADRTADYVLREMTSPEGSFYSAQDADSDGEEGKYYLLTPEEILRLLGAKDGEAFCAHFDISPTGNFKGRSIPNLLNSDFHGHTFDAHLERVRQYRRERCTLHLDDKILTAWNGLMIAALCKLYQASGNVRYLNAAKKADGFIRESLRDGDTLYVSYRNGRRGVQGFLDDYAAYAFAQLALYSATLDTEYIEHAKRLCETVEKWFMDEAHGGYYLYAADGESLILRPKETYDGAMPSGNSMMAWNLVRLSQLTDDTEDAHAAEHQLAFMASAAAESPTGYAMFLLALMDRETPPPRVTVVLAKEADACGLPLSLPPDAVVTLLRQPTAEYPLKDGQTTFYICRNHSCLPATNDPGDAYRSLMPEKLQVR